MLLEPSLSPFLPLFALLFAVECVTSSCFQSVLFYHCTSICANLAAGEGRSSAEAAGGQVEGTSIFVMFLCLFSCLFSVAPGAQACRIRQQRLWGRHGLFPRYEQTIQLPLQHQARMRLDSGQWRVETFCSHPRSLALSFFVLSLSTFSASFPALCVHISPFFLTQHAPPPYDAVKFNPTSFASGGLAADSYWSFLSSAGYFQFSLFSFVLGILS